MSESVESAGIFLAFFSLFGFSFGVYVVLALLESDSETTQATKDEHSDLLATDRVIHCWEDHPEAPLECICNSGSKKAGEPCVLNRH